MIKAHKHLIGIAVLIFLLLPCSAPAQQQTTDQLKNPSDNQITIFRALRHLPCRTEGGAGCHDLKYRGRTLEFDVTAQTKNNAGLETTNYTIDMTTLPTITYECMSKRHWSGIVSWKSDECGFKAGGQDTSPEVARLLSSPHDAPGDFVARALNRVHEFSLQTNSPLNNFSQAAAAWRALPQRPPLLDAVRVQRLLAEDALKQGQPYMALYYYETGLEKDLL